MVMSLIPSAHIMTLTIIRSSLPRGAVLAQIRVPRVTKARRKVNHLYADVMIADAMIANVTLNRLSLVMTRFLSGGTIRTGCGMSPVAVVDTVPVPAGSEPAVQRLSGGAGTVRFR